MKFKKITVPKYIFKDELGTYDFHNVKILVEVASTVTPEAFDQERDDYSISSNEIERMNKESAQRFFNDKYKKILQGEYALSPQELNGIRLFLDVNGSGLAKLLNLNKGHISKLINKGDEHKIQPDTMLLVMEKMHNEIESPGISKATLDNLKENSSDEATNLDVPSDKISEWIIRKFVELEDHVTNLKLQKLLYYSQGVAIGRYNCNLISDKFYAWEHGPVIKKIYHKYSVANSSPLSIDAGADIREVTKNELAVKILNDTMNTYGKLGAWVLRDKTHCETPWLITDQQQEIEPKVIEEFFKGVLI